MTERLLIAYLLTADKGQNCFVFTVSTLYFRTNKVY